MRFLPGPARVPVGPESRNSDGMSSMKIAWIATRTKRLLLKSALGAFAPARSRSIPAEPNCRVIESTGPRLAAGAHMAVN